MRPQLGSCARKVLQGALTAKEEAEELDVAESGELDGEEAATLDKTLLSVMNADKSKTALLAVYPAPGHDGICVLPCKQQWVFFP